jgi:capsular polysaccharide biosynthesis protein
VGTSYGSDLSFTTTATTPVAPAVTLLALKVISPKPIKPWKVAHTLNHVPTVIIPSMTSAGNIWWTAVDGTNISLMGSASGLTAVFYVE